MQEMLKNPGFDKGVPYDWTAYSTGTKQKHTYPEAGRSGPYTFSVAIEYPAREIGKRAMWIQHVNIDTGKKYKLSGWMKTKNVIGVGAIIKIDWKDASGKYLGESKISNFKTGSIPWTYFEGEVTPDKRAAKATVVLGLYDCSGKVWFDDISLSISSVMPPDSGGKGVDIYLDQDEVNTIKSRLNTDPWKIAYNKFMSSDVSWAFRLGTQSVVYGGPIPPSRNKHDYYTQPPYVKDGIYDPKVSRADYTAVINVSKAVRALGLAYALTGENRYADKAIQLINGWCVNSATKMNPRFWYSGQNGQVFIENYITIPGMFYGASLIWNYSGWRSSEKNAFKSWVRSMLDKVKDPFNNCGDHCQNFENWRLVFVSSAAVLLENNDAMNAAFRRWKELIPLQIDTSPFGRMRYEYTRSTSLDYSTYAVNAMIQTAEIARHHGVDLYNYRLKDGRGLEAVLDFHAPYVTDPSKWPYKQIRPYNGGNAALYELAYKFKRKDAYLRAINRWKRPMYDIRTMGPTTLTHGVKVV